MRQAGFFDVDERLRELSAKGDDLDRLVLLCHEVLETHGHRGRCLARACARWMRRVVIEVSTWRSGLRGSAPGTVALGKASREDCRLWA